MKQQQKMTAFFILEVLRKHRRENKQKSGRYVYQAGFKPGDGLLS